MAEKLALIEISALSSRKEQRINILFVGDRLRLCVCVCVCMYVCVCASRDIPVRGKM